MKKLFFLLFLLNGPLLAQNTNYVANTANAVSPGTNNTIVGPAAGNPTMLGNNNAFLGYFAGLSNTTGNLNAFVGYYTGFSNTEGHKNTFMGVNAGYSNNTGNSNIFLGYSAGYYNTSGSNNIIIGPNSGTTVTTGDDNVLMGYNSQASDGLNHATAIGADARVAVSNAVILGNNANVGIGTSAPTVRLEVVSEAPNVSGLRLANLTTNSPVVRSTDQFLTVNEAGDVVKARYQLRINSANEWSDKVFTPTYPLRPLKSVAAYISQHGHLPGIPSAQQVVREGVDIVRMNATLLEKVEELTLYSIQLEKANQQHDTELQVVKEQHQQALQAMKQKQAELERLLKKLLKRH